MSDAFSYKHRMRLPSRIITLAGNGVASLSELDPGSIKFCYRVKDSQADRKLISATPIGDPADLQVQVDFAAVDTGTEAQYEWHIEATINGLTLAWPERGFYTFSITDTIEGP